MQHSDGFMSSLYTVSVESMRFLCAGVADGAVLVQDCRQVSRYDSDTR